MNRIIDVPDSAISNAEWLVETMKRLRTMSSSYERVHLLENAVYTAQLTYMILDIQKKLQDIDRETPASLKLRDMGL
jgi:hypothetical protein